MFSNLVKSVPEHIVDKWIYFSYLSSCYLGIEIIIDLIDILLFTNNSHLLVYQIIRCSVFLIIIIIYIFIRYSYYS